MLIYFLSCPNRHTWTKEYHSRPDLGTEDEVCPICGCEGGKDSEEEYGGQ